jgi:hypothetical protein
MKIKTFLLMRLAMCAALCLPVIIVMAQGDPGGDPDPGNGVPFDGGLTLLIAAGIGYAAKKGYDKRKKHQAAKHDDAQKM